MPCVLAKVNLVMRKENREYSSLNSFKYAARVIHHELNIQFNYHALRHIHATMLIENGISVKSVQERLLTMPISRRRCKPVSTTQRR